MPTLTPARPDYADALHTIQRQLHAGTRLAGAVQTVLSVLTKTRDAATEQRLAALDAAIEILEAEMVHYAGRAAVARE